MSQRAFSARSLLCFFSLVFGTGSIYVSFFASSTQQPSIKIVDSDDQIAASDDRSENLNSGKVVSKYFTLWSTQWDQVRQEHGVTAFIAAAKSSGFDTMVCSIRLGQLLEKDSRELGEIPDMDTAVSEACQQGLTSIVVLDFWLTNDYVLNIFPKVVDAQNRVYQAPSTGSSEYMDFVEEIIQKVAERYRHNASMHCVRALSPNFNNELETRYSQEYDAFQDYSPSMLEKYRSWLQSSGNIDFFNARWHTRYETLSDVLPPPLFGDSLPGMFNKLFMWDWQEFREYHISKVVERSCKAAADKGLRCFLHVAESFTTLDAILTVPFYRLMKSPYVHEVAVDSNFISFMGASSGPDVAGLLSDMTHMYHKTVYFEAAVERYRDKPQLLSEIVHKAFQIAITCGVNIGVTNVLDPQFFGILLPEHIANLPHVRHVPQALLFSPYRSYYSYRRQVVEGRDKMQLTLMDAYSQLLKLYPSGVEVVGDEGMLTPEYVRRFQTKVLHLPPDVMVYAADSRKMQQLLLGGFTKSETCSDDYVAMLDDSLRDLSLYRTAMP